MRTLILAASALLSACHAAPAPLTYNLVGVDSVGEGFVLDRGLSLRDCRGSELGEEYAYTVCEPA